MTRRVMCWLGLLTASVLLVGCGGGMEPGVPPDATGALTKEQQDSMKIETSIDGKALKTVP